MKSRFPLRFSSSPVALKLGCFLMFLLLSVIAGADLLAPYDPLLQNPSIRLQAPTSSHLLGTDQFGRDLLSRLIYGGRTTLGASFLALFTALLLGVSAGLLSGYCGGIVDAVLTRILDVLMAFPFMVFAIIVTALFGTGFIHLLFAIVSVWWVPFARLARSIALHCKEEPDILAALVLGAPNSIVIFRELFPRALPSALVLGTFELGSLILSVSALSFFGLGSKPPSPEWGAMLADSKAYFFHAPHLVLGPTLFIFLAVFSLNLIGEGLRDRLDPFEIPFF